MLRSRRSVLRDLAGLAACAPLLSAAAAADTTRTRLATRASQFIAKNPLNPVSDARLEESEHRAFRFFCEQSDPATGLTKDRNLANSANDPRDIASIAATGFGLTMLTIADKRGWMKTPQLIERARVTLRFVNDRAFQQHGFLYHFMQMVIRLGAALRPWERLTVPLFHAQPEDQSLFCRKIQCSCCRRCAINMASARGHVTASLMRSIRSRLVRHRCARH